MRPVAVIGASGFIGNSVLEHLRNAEISAKGFTRGGRGIAAPGTLRCDYLDVASMQAALAGCGAVVHIAGLAHVNQRRGVATAQEYQIANVDAALSVARAAIAAGANRLVLLSSAGVMGAESPPGGFRDSHAAAPFDDYTRSKHLAELRVQDLAAPGFSVVVLRPPMVYGRGAPGSFDRIVKWILRGWPLPLAAASARRSVIGIGNLCDVIAAAATVAEQAHGAMLVADAEPLPVSDFLREVGSAMNRRVRMVSIPPTMLKLVASALGRSQDLQRLNGAFEISGTQAATALGWVPRHSTGDELCRALGGSTR